MLSLLSFKKKKYFFFMSLKTCIPPHLLSELMGLYFDTQTPHNTSSSLFFSFKVR